MFAPRLLLPSLALILALAACAAPATPTSLPHQPAPATQTPILATAIPPTAAPATETSVPTTVIPTTDAPAVSSLTLEQLQNAEVKITGSLGTAPERTVQLTGGGFESGNDPTSSDYVSVHMGQQVAHGDINGDGNEDAAIILAENYGGTGVFTSVAVMLNQGGQPVFAASHLIDDRPQVNSLAIQNGEIWVDAIIHGSNDPGCCPAQPITQTFRLWDNKLTLTNHTSKTPDGRERIIKIDSPANGSEISGAFTITGSVTIAPFENNLVYTVFLEGTPDPIAQAGFMVDADGMGGPGTFNLPLDLTATGAKGNLRIEISDVSAADGSYFAVDTLFLTLK